MPDNSEFEGQVAGGSSFLPEQEMEELIDTDGSEDEDELMDQDETIMEAQDTAAVDISGTGAVPPPDASGSKAGKVSAQFAT